uniref:Intercellular adhesion molecule N-terminal domain-containing protein n=1 Tax=Chelonoidis abingdonii TaxID=106734 RepID=A0A8C0ILW6_CHEAB
MTVVGTGESEPTTQEQTLLTLDIYCSSLNDPCFLHLLLFPFPPLHPGRLTVLPLEPLVQIGGSIQLNCSLDCPDGKPQWKGLDTNLGNIISTPTYSLLLITNAAVAMAGTKFCTGNCQGKSHQGSTNLQVTDSAIAIGTASSLLGLIVTAFVSHRLWRLLHPPGMTSPKGNSV